MLRRSTQHGLPRYAQHGLSGQVLVVISSFMISLHFVASYLLSNFCHYSLSLSGSGSSSFLITEQVKSKDFWSVLTDEYDFKTCDPAS